MLKRSSADKSPVIAGQNSTTNADPVVPDSAPTNAPHEEILEGLLEYTRFPHGQGFAVMLNGPWGSGKTTFIKRNIDAFGRERPGEVKQKPLYVSLYGISDVSQIEDRLFEQLHPILSHSATRLIGAVLRGAAKTAVKVDIAQGFSLSGSAAEVDLSAMLNNAEGRVVIFDDFERAIMATTAILGYINPLVEHEDCKVIILADETQIKDCDEYKTRKEKTIGRTFDFRPDFSYVYSELLRNIDEHSARGFLAESTAAVGKVFADSQYDNLRLLKLFMWDFERVWKVITSEQRECRVAMDELLELLCASSLELRHGLPAQDFHLSTPRSLIAQNLGGAAAKKSPMEVIQNKYPSVRFDSSLLDSDTILDIVMKSKVSADIVRLQLQRHPYFAEPEAINIPSWRALWSAFELSPLDQHSTLARFEADFDRRIFYEVGEIYHIFGLGLWLSTLEFPGWEAKDLEDKLKRYVDDTYAQRKPTIPDVTQRTSPDLMSGAYGLGYRQSDHYLFSTLVKYEECQRAAWRKQCYPEIADNLREMASQDGEQFLRSVCFTSGGPATFAKISVLNHIAPQDFVNIVLATPYHEQSKIAIALSIRYEQVSGYEELRDEIPWLREVKALLETESSKLTPISRHAVLQLSHHHLDKAIRHIDRYEQQLQAQDSDARGQ